MMRAKVLFITAACLIGILNTRADASEAANSKGHIEKTFNKVIELYNNENYDESLEVLESIKSFRTQNANWFYYFGLNKARNGQYDEAQESLESYINRSKLTETARANYYLGLVQFYKGDYEHALNSLQLSLDISTDPKLDKMTDSLIDKTVRYQNYFENTKKLNFTFLLGYNNDSDVLNLAPDSFTEKLGGHVFNYGASMSYKMVDKYSFIFQPALAILDSYTFDNSFKANSTLQGNDALQFLLTLPLHFYMENEVNPNKYDFALNGYSMYLPISSSTRELSLSSFFLQGQVTTFLSLKYSMRNSMILAADKGYGYTSDDDDASGLRFEYLGTILQYLDVLGSKNISYDFGVSYDSAKGINSRYSKYILGVGYSFPTFWGLTSTSKFEYFYLNYPDKSTARIDNQVNASFLFSKTLSTTANLAVSLTATNNVSNIDLNKYSDLALGVQYTKAFGY